MDKFESLEKLAKLKSDWILTEEEFAAEKKKLLDPGKEPAYAPPAVSAVPPAPAAWTEAPKARKDPRLASLPTYHDSRNETFFQAFLSHKWRISREQWIWRIVLLVLGFLLMEIFLESYKEIKSGLSSSEQQIVSVFGIVFIVAWLSSFYGCFAVTAKRFHDLDTTGWAQLIPIYGFLAPLFVQGDAGDNKYGPPPS